MVSKFTLGLKHPVFQSNYYQLDPDSLDYDRRVRKRRARLLAATEEAFESVRRVNDLGSGKGECRRNQLDRINRNRLPVHPTQSMRCQLCARVS